MTNRENANRRVTAADVAEKAGVSMWTVIRAFKPDGIIADKTRERVLGIAHSMGYAPNLLAKSLRTKKTGQIAVLMEDFANPYKLPTLDLLTKELQRNSLCMVLFNVNQHFALEEALVNAQQRQFDAIVLFSLSYDSDELALLSKRVGIPIFVLARDSHMEMVPAFTTKVETAIMQICLHLFERGYENPAYMHAPKNEKTSLGRRREFGSLWKQRIGKHPVEIRSQSYSLESGADALRKYLNTTMRKNWCDVVMCENDVLAIGALEVARSEFNLSVPSDLAIVGFDDIEMASLPSIDLTTYRQPYEQMVKALVEQITGRATLNSVYLEGEFIWRATT